MGFALTRFLPLSLANAFDKYANADFGRLPEQFERGTRVDVDIGVIKCLSISPIGDEDVKALRSGLSGLYTWGKPRHLWRAGMRGDNFILVMFLFF